MNERKQITIECNGSTKRSIKRTQNLYLPDTFSFEKFFKESKTIKEYDWAGTVIKKVVILNFPGVLFAFGKVYQISGNDNIWFVSMEEINVELLKIRTIEWIKKKLRR